MASENAFLHFVDNASTEESAASDQEANGPPLTTLRRCVGVEPRKGGVALEYHSHAHKSWWQKARESRANPPCACVGLRWPSARSLPSSLPLRCCSVIGFIHATMPLSQHTQLVPKTRSLTLFVLLSTSPLHPNRTQSAHGTGALRQRSSDAMNGGGHYPTYVFRCGGGQLWMWDVGCEG